MASKTAISPHQPLSPARSAAIRRRLLAWYDRRQRDLPWRRTRDSYRVWLSEIMLQQTQVATVIPYYERFLNRFPTVADLARAKLDDVLHLWAGLGYYARARNLHRCAQIVATQFAGQFPTTAAVLRELPGIGRYTAGAIASVCAGQRTPIVDCNVARVLSRLALIRTDISRGPGLEACWTVAEKLLPATACGDFNQSLMELGATICTPGAAAQCNECPIKSCCAAFESNLVAELPIKKLKTTVKPEVHIALALEHNGKYLFLRRPLDGLWGGLWELPTVTVKPRERPLRIVHELAARLTSDQYNLNPTPQLRVAHQLSHRSIQFILYRAKSTRRHARPSAGQQWLLPANMSAVALSTIMQKITTQLIPRTAKILPNQKRRRA